MTKNKIKKWIKLNWHGALFGAIASPLLFLIFDLEDRFIWLRPLIFKDSLCTTFPAVGGAITCYGMFIVIILIGLIIGAFIDSVWKPKK